MNQGKTLMCKTLKCTKKPLTVALQERSLGEAAPLELTAVCGQSSGINFQPVDSLFVQTLKPKPLIVFVLEKPATGHAWVAFQAPQSKHTLETKPCLTQRHILVQPPCLQTRRGDVFSAVPWSRSTFVQLLCSRIGSKLGRGRNKPYHTYNSNST